MRKGVRKRRKRCQGKGVRFIYQKIREKETRRKGVRFIYQKINLTPYFC